MGREWCESVALQDQEFMNICDILEREKTLFKLEPSKAITQSPI